MKAALLLLAVVSLFPTSAWGGNAQELRMSVSDTFLIEETENWNVQVEKMLTLRFADVKITPKRGYDFSLMLFFKCDTPDLAQFDTPEKMATSVVNSSQGYLPYTVEKEIVLKPAPVAPSYGFMTVLTDAAEAKKANQGPGKFKYMTRGMIRLSMDSALGFSLMSNDIHSADYRRLLDYIYGFVVKDRKAWLKDE